MNNKLISFAAAAATLFAFAACNKDANQIDVVTPGTGTYAKVSISMGTPGTRATDADRENADGGIDKGTKDESQVNSIMLVVYDGDEPGSQVVGYGSTGKQDDPTLNNANVSDTYVKVIELTMMPGKSKTDAQYVVAYINVTDENLVNFGAAMEETTAAIQETIQEKSYFIMTNSATGNDKDWSVATQINPNSLYSSPEAADASSATTQIYVERLAAKVRVALESANIDTEAKIKIFGVDGKTEYHLNFDTDKAVWAPTGTALEMYKLKNQWTEALKWTTAGDHRNFWAKGLYYDTDYADFTDKVKSKNILHWLSSNELRKKDTNLDETPDHFLYTTEHTYGDKVIGLTKEGERDPKSNYNVLGAATSVFVLGQYTVTGNNASRFWKEVNNDKGEKTGEGYDFYLLLNKAGDTDTYTIFTDEELVKYLCDANKLDLQKLENDSYTDITDENLTTYFKLAWDGTDKKYRLNYLGGLYNKEDHTEFVPETDLTAATNARHYNIGYAYFYAPIQHLAAEGVGKYGVVRNHVYDMKVKSITSLGAPLDDDHFGTDPDDPEDEDPGDEPIIPDPDEAALIRAELNVLSWHVVSQGVDL